MTDAAPRRTRPRGFAPWAPRPETLTDRRAFAGETVQAEAIPPDVLTRLVADAIAERQDADAFAETLEAEDGARAALLSHLEELA